MATDKHCKNQLGSPSPAQCMEHYGCIYENNHLITLMVDPVDGSIADANRAACKFYGYRLRDFRKLHIADLNADGEGSRGSFVEKAMPGGQYPGNRVFTEKHKLAGGQQIDVEIHTGIITMLGKNCIYTVIHDISERVRSELRLRESEERYRDLVELCPEAILVYSGGRIRFANQQTAKMFGRKKEDLIGRSIDEFLHEEPLCCTDYNKLAVEGSSKDHFRIEQRFTRHDQQVFDLDISGASIVYEGAPALQLVFRDITENKKEIERAVKMQDHRHAVAFPLEDKAVLTKLYIPATTLSGDFFIFHKINQDQVIGIIGDVTGKGISAALSISALRVLFVDSLLHSWEPVRVLEDLNLKAMQHLGEDYISVCCFLLDFDKKTLKAAGGGINEFIYVPKGSDGQQYVVKGAPLGMFSTSEFEQKVIPFDSGDRFCFYSDGMELLFEGKELSGDYEYLHHRVAGACLQDDCTWLSLHIK